MATSPYQNRTWTEVDLNALRNNYRVIRERLSSRAKLCCVVKANAYGHGAPEVARLFESLGADYFAVSNIEEALQLRAEKIAKPILILGHTDPKCAAILARYKIEQSVFSEEYAKELSSNAERCGVEIGAHFKLDTGMGRIGFGTRDSGELGDDLLRACALPRLNRIGIFTHFASADEGDAGRDYTLRQFQRFTRATEGLERAGFAFQIRHCANSAAIFDYPETHLDMARAGVVLYGLRPSNELVAQPDLRPALALKTIVVHLKTLQPGECVSYGRRFVAQRETRVATLPIGYADGYWRSNSMTAVVKIRGQYAPVIGRVCMDQMMVDVTDVSGVAVNDEVVAYDVDGPCSVDAIADANDTINYEIVCAIGERAPRIYRENGRVVAVLDNIVSEETQSKLGLKGL